VAGENSLTLGCDGCLLFRETWLSARGGRAKIGVGLRLFLSPVPCTSGPIGSRACAAFDFDQVIIMNKAKCFNIGCMYEDYRE